MTAIPEQFKQLLVTAVLVLFIMPALAQAKYAHVAKKKLPPVSPRLTEFYHLASGADVEFEFPKGFKEIKAPDDEDFSFDYGISLPGKEFEIWFQVKSEKENWTAYERTQNNKNAQSANPDSVYAAIAAAQTIAFTGEKKTTPINIPPDILSRYHADEGKSYLLNLLDLPAIKHYRYALLITLHKNHTGTIMAVCFTNDKGPEFFKNINQAGNCLKFKS